MLRPLPMNTTAPASPPAPATRGHWLSKLGPGLITGAADDDPSGIATYSQAGAQFGFSTLWTLLLTLPLMIGIQVISARIGRVSGHGLASTIRRHYPRPLLFAIVGLLMLANTINIAADIAAMGSAATCWWVATPTCLPWVSACCRCCCRYSCPTGAMCAC